MTHLATIIAINESRQIIAFDFDGDFAVAEVAGSDHFYIGTRFNFDTRFPLGSRDLKMGGEVHHAHFEDAGIPIALLPSRLLISQGNRVRIAPQLSAIARELASFGAIVVN